MVVSTRMVDHARATAFDAILLGKSGDGHGSVSKGACSAYGMAALVTVWRVMMNVDTAPHDDSPSRDISEANPVTLRRRESE